MDFRFNLNSGGGGGGGPSFNQGRPMNEAFNLAANFLVAAIGNQNKQPNHFGGPGTRSLLQTQGPQTSNFNWRQQVTQRAQHESWQSPQGNSNNMRQNQSYQQRRHHPRSAQQQSFHRKRGGKMNSSIQEPYVSESTKKNDPAVEKEKCSSESTEVKKDSEVSKMEVEEEAASGCGVPEKSEKKDNSKYAGIPSNLLHCSACNKTMWNGESYERHLNGALHERMVELMNDKHERMVALLRQHIKMLEARREAGLYKMKKHSPKVLDSKCYCPMCDIHVFGSILTHRNTQHHQKLKDYLHPRCKVCNKQFTLRSDWDEHQLTEPHLRNLASCGGEQLLQPEDDHFDLMDIGRRKGKEVGVKGEETISFEKEEEAKLLTDAKIADYQIPKFDEAKGVGTSFIKPVKGSFCRICKKFLHSEAVNDHMKTRAHYDQFVEAVNGKKAKRLEKEENERKRKSQGTEEDAKPDSNVKMMKIEVNTCAAVGVVTES